MGETGNIEELAKIVSNDIFKWLKWEKRPLIDVNWECVTDEHDKKTHPSDVVFHYIDPYSGVMNYINTDLKSYAKASITPIKIKGAINSLSMAVECANISNDWQNKFDLNLTGQSKVLGLLFIYNHDDEYDNTYETFASKIDFSTCKIKNNNRIAVFGPDKIRNLANIVNDIKLLNADEVLPSYKDYSFFYPDLVLSKRQGNEWNQPASIEALTSPYIIIKYKNTDDMKDGYIIYYNRLGTTVEEFVYLLDTLSHYQLLSSKNNIRIRFVEAQPSAVINLEKAKNLYLESWGFEPERKKLIHNINAGCIQNIIKQFNPLEIGMNHDEH